MTTKSDVSQQTGVGEEAIADFKIQLKELRKLGVLISVDVTGFSIFIKSATSAEWGIANADVRHSRLKGGQKLLIPEVYIRRLKSIEVQFRQLVAKYAFSEVTYFRPYWFISLASFESFRADWLDLEKELASLKREIASKYADFVDLLADDFGQIAERAWRGVKAQKLDEIRFGKHLFKDEPTFVDHVKAAAVAKMPDKSDIGRKISASYNLATISIDVDAEADMLANEENAAMQEIWKAELARKKTRIAQGNSPVIELQSALRKRFALMAETMLESVNKNGLVRGKIAKQIAGLQDFYARMSVINDKELSGLIASLIALVGEVGDKRTKDAPGRDVEKIAANLQSLIDLAEQELEAGSTFAGRFTSLEIEDD